MDSLKHTEVGKSYWAGNAAYSEFLDAKFNELVPDNGNAETVHGELVRAISRLVYEHCNNGNGNSRDAEWEDDDCGSCNGDGKQNCQSCYGDGEEECEDCDGDGCGKCGDTGVEDCIACSGTGEEDCDECLGAGVLFEEIEVPFIDDYYDEMLRFLEFNLENGSKLVQPLRDIILHSPSDFSDEVMHKYSLVGDAVAHTVLTTENKPI
jgi:hypothetical protein